MGTHVRRLGGRRANYLDRSLRNEKLQQSRKPVRVEVLSWQRLEDLPQALGSTWLDRKLVGKEPDALAPTGFGADVANALRATMADRAGADARRGQPGALCADMLEMLEARELTRTASEISARTVWPEAGTGRTDTTDPAEFRSWSRIFRPLTSRAMPASRTRWSSIRGSCARAWPPRP
ncbi:DUF3363 domain-containing protein [Bradyrhizobium arachidis]|uniref:DUF3363 domain-containing protein n=1 Tax=Bradyrhizobium arachidis TaxID=858423 RepID=UPI0038D13BF9